MFENPDVLAERLRAAAPAGFDAGVARVAIIPDLDPDESWTDRLVALERVKAAAEAEQMTVMAAMRGWAEDWLQEVEAESARSQTTADRRRNAYGRPTAEEVVADHVAPALHLAPTTAAIRVDRAARIAGRLPGALAALRRGELDLGRLLAIDEATRLLDDEAARHVEERVLRRAVDQTAAELRAALRKAVIAVDPDGAERRRRTAVKTRSVVRYAGDDGMSVLQATLSAIDTGEIYDLVDEVARRTRTTDDTRTMDQRRADALIHLLLGRDPHLGPDEPLPPPPEDPPAGPEDGPPDPAGHDVTRAGDLPERDLPEHDQPADVLPTDDHRADGASADEDMGATTAGERTEQSNGSDGSEGSNDPGMAEPADLDERFPPDADPISELTALALSAMISRRPPRLPWVAITATTGRDGSMVLVAELQGYGPITDGYAVHLLTRGSVRIPDRPSGRDPTPTEASTHDPPGWLDLEIRARDGTCRFPGCRRPAHRVDLDHTVAFPRGRTVRTNLGGLCRRHHRTKTAGVWRLDQAPDGTGVMTWTSRLTGARYLTHARGTTGDWRGTDRPDRRRTFTE